MPLAIVVFHGRLYIPEDRRRSGLREERMKEEHAKNCTSKQHKKGAFAPLTTLVEGRSGAAPFTPVNGRSRLDLRYKK